MPLAKSIEIKTSPRLKNVPDQPDWEPPDYAGVFQKGEVVGYYCRTAEIEALQQVIDQHG